MLAEVRAGNEEAKHVLFERMYDELRLIAHRQRQRWRGNYAYDTSAILHEFFIKVFKASKIKAREKREFFSFASTTMRRILIDQAAKYDQKVTLVTTMGGTTQQRNWLDLNKALDQLEAHNPRWAKFIELRFFCGLKNQDISEIMGIPMRTMERIPRAAMDFLRKEMPEYGDVDNR